MKFGTCNIDPATAKSVSDAYDENLWIYLRMSFYVPCRSIGGDTKSITSLVVSLVDDCYVEFADMRLALGGVIDRQFRSVWISFHWGLTCIGRKGVF
jgi:hypothetical protein